MLDSAIRYGGKTDLSINELSKQKHSSPNQKKRTVAERVTANANVDDAICTAGESAHVRGRATTPCSGGSGISIANNSNKNSKNDSRDIENDFLYDPKES